MTTEERRSKNKEIKAFHQATLDAIGIPNAILMSKMAYKATESPEKFIAFFESEIGKGEDIYIEFGNKELVAEKVEGYELRALLKYRNNPNYKSEYLTSDPTEPNTRYFIPISELVLVTKPVKKNLSTKTTTVATSPEKIDRESTVSELKCAPIDNTDPLVKDLTIRDYAAIHMRKPMSNKTWLNDLIKAHS